MGPASATPVGVAPLPPGEAAVFVEVAPTFDAAPLRMTLSDGERWHRRATDPRWEVAGGFELGRWAAALLAGVGSFGAAGQVDVVTGPAWRAGITGTARAVYGGGYDLALVPGAGVRAAEGRLGTVVPFAALRLRGGRTLYQVQGPSAGHPNAWASVATDDLAVAPMIGVALAWRYAELRATLGWEAILASRIREEERPAALSRGSGAFALVAARVRLGRAPP